MFSTDFMDMIEYCYVYLTVFLGANFGMLFAFQMVLLWFIFFPVFTSWYLVVVFYVCIYHSQASSAYNIAKEIVQRSCLALSVVSAVRFVLYLVNYDVDINLGFRVVAVGITFCVFVAILCVAWLTIANNNQLVDLYRRWQLFWYYNLFMVPSLYIFAVLFYSRYKEKKQIADKITKSVKRKINKRETVAVGIIVCTYNEGLLLKHCIDSLVQCMKYLRFEFENSNEKSWVSLDIDCKLIVADSNSTDGSIKLIENMVDKIYNCCKPGKLTARDYVMTNEQKECDIFVSCDSDRQYPKDWLVNILSPLLLHEKDKNGCICCFDTDWYYYCDFISAPLNGGASAFFSQLYGLIPFDVDRSQNTLLPIWSEEEWLFGMRMQMLGKTKKQMSKYSERNNQHDTILQQIVRHWGFRTRNF